MLGREFGYSYVEIPDGCMGYIANEEISPAPASESVRSASPVRKRSAGNSLATGNEASAALDSLPEIEVLPEPMDVHYPISGLDSSTDSKPEFRY